MFRTLSEEGINIQMISTSEIKTSSKRTRAPIIESVILVSAQAHIV